MSKPDVHMANVPTTLHDYAIDLAELGHDAALVDGPPLKRGEVAALALLGSEEIVRLRTVLDQWGLVLNMSPKDIEDAKTGAGIHAAA